ncbi:MULTISPECIES: hypothetical protein [Alicyclobacillus]|uniref:Uncharacterized protein n=1 Tax=Alicyclobacillus acidoterrestris (strain ATCC 49025 / DSM 3922 / CIP 106132 / NCIMB 13137 / GD3B) TaxID=1356854 RepID=T0BR86_ALIAG|nr:MULTISPECIES: hypothetical protein [Alicyclobacillus]EPZ43294.1 hypothetical protein N007_13430 [Alicyclobacillus acidoterrestris ATCC 49025]UNO47712.1 hypothetical protein K1I37_13550 [Alicyclobacillus acidoterrestris]GEO27360.1 hypothetical protein AAC03nite_31450 [Alicyclobacillus acidoterrestris]
MFAKILCLAIILTLALKMDYQMLKTEGNRKERMIYGTLFTVGFLGTATYLLAPWLPTPLDLIQGPIQPVHAWLAS